MSAPTLTSPTIRGIKYPLTIQNGNLATSTDFDLVSEQIRSIVETRFFERVMRADYGVGDHTLEVMNPGLINSEFQTSIAEYVSGLSSLSVNGDWSTSGEDGVYRVFISYAINGVPQPPLQFSLSN